MHAVRDFRPLGRLVHGVLSLSLLAALPACVSQQRTPDAAPSPTKRVAALLCGHFTSEVQAKADPEYFEVHLHMTQIWPERADGPWLYVEQAMATALDKPYRQRIYRLTACPSWNSSVATTCVRSEVFELPNAPDRVGAWSDPSRFASDSPETLVQREGCAISLMPTQALGVDNAHEVARDVWSGSTEGDLCLSTLRGATYATSEVWLSPELLRTWDRGFDAQGTQVWGAKKGPYEFVRVHAREVK